MSEIETTAQKLAFRLALLDDQSFAMGAELGKKYSGAQLTEQVTKANALMSPKYKEIDKEISAFVSTLSNPADMEAFKNALVSAKRASSLAIRELPDGHASELYKIYNKKGVDEAMLAMKENKLADLAKATAEATNRAEYASKNAVVKFFTKEEGGMRFGRVTAVTGAVLAAGTGIYLLTHKKKEPEGWADKENTRRAAAAQAQPSVA